MNEIYLRNTILKLCLQPRSFEYISKSLNGLDPIEAIRILTIMEKENELVNIDGLWSHKEKINENLSLFNIVESNTSYLQKYMGYFDFLKTPHPLDFEWRNSTFSLKSLLNKLTGLVIPSDKLLFLGMPTLFATAILADIANDISLIERNSPIIEGLKRINTDQNRFKIIEDDIFTMNPILASQYYAVMMDPPWYTEHFFQFMWLAAKSIKISGIIAISLPPINTRPDIMNERLEWFSFCNSLGLCIESIEPQQLHYSMPFFEFNAFRAAGLTQILPFWRKGDLAIFRKIKDVNIERPQYNKINKYKWVEREYKSSRIRIRIEKENHILDENLRIESIIKGDILPTVSSRDERRDQANVWTSGNRIFFANNTCELIKIIDKILKESELNNEELKIKNFFDHIEDLEQKESNDYLDLIYYEMERQAD